VSAADEPGEGRTHRIRECILGNPSGLKSYVCCSQ
jgi:hypothetical protein